jgi:hypothetical protein
MLGGELSGILLLLLLLLVVDSEDDDESDSDVAGIDSVVSAPASSDQLMEDIFSRLVVCKDVCR